MKNIFHTHYINIFVLALLASVAYLPGLSDFWVSDDIPNIVNNPAIQIDTLDSNNLMTAATANKSGPLGRPLSSLSFGLNYYFSGQQLDAGDFKITNLVIHISNGILVYLIALYLIKALKISINIKIPEKHFAIIVAAIWTLHPIQLTAVLYAVQRMTSLSALFVLAGLLIFVIGRMRLYENKAYATTLMYIGIGIGTLLGSLCKENALLLPYLALAIEITIFSKLTCGQQQKKAITFYALTAVIPAILAVIYLTIHPERIFAGYTVRDFTITERLMTESRVVLLYISYILFPAIQNLTLYHDTIEISRSLINPWTTLPALIIISSSAILSFWFRHKTPILTFSVLWFLTAHSMESTVFPLILMYEHRNYVASFSIIFAACYYGLAILNHLINTPIIKTCAPILVVLCMTALTHVRSEIWSDSSTLSYFNVKNSPNSAQAHASRAIYLLEHGDKQEAYKHLSTSSRLNQSDTSSPMAMLQLLTTFRLLTAEGKLETQATQKTPQNYHAPLVLNIDYMTKLHNIIDNEIRHRLINQQLSIPTTLALRSSTDCAVKGLAAQCLAIIDEIYDWLEIALQKETLPDRQRPILFASRARIHAYQGRIKLAIDDLDTAYQEQPKDIYLLIDKLTLLITLHDWDNTRALIDKIKNHPHIERHHHLALDKATRLYELEKSQIQGLANAE